eukprot:scaffold13013_cov128-Isochrysis_galbana.AAC.5
MEKMSLPPRRSSLPCTACERGEWPWPSRPFQSMHAGQSGLTSSEQTDTAVHAVTSSLLCPVVESSCDAA